MTSTSASLVSPIELSATFAPVTARFWSFFVVTALLPSFFDVTARFSMSSVSTLFLPGSATAVPLIAIASAMKLTTSEADGLRMPEFMCAHAPSLRDCLRSNLSRRPAHSQPWLLVDRPAVDCASGVEDRLGHRRVGVHDARKLLIAALERLRVDDLGDHVAGDVPDHVRAQDFPVLGVGDDLDDALAVVVDGRRPDRAD